MNFFSLHEEVKSTDSAVRFLQEKGILPINMQCSRGHEAVLNLDEKRQRWRCNIRGCREEKSLRVGTYLAGSRLPYSTIILFMYAWAHEMVNIKFCEKELGMNKNSTADWCNYMHEVCANCILRSRSRIGGPNLTEGIDESLFSRRKNHTGRALPQQWIFGGICRGTKDCFLVAVPDRTAATLLPIINERIVPGSTIMSDKWKSYEALARDSKYTHLTFNHSVNFVDPRSGAHTQSIESLWCKAKARNKKQWGTHRSLLDSYLSEFMWRQTLKGDDKDPFDSILEEIVQIWQPSTTM